ncbi:MAG: transcriptional regulator [Micrococcales bacterium 73-13]|nr:MAG: transcriptional regulator [Micrococcales bacterium 73-13]
MRHTPRYIVEDPEWVKGLIRGNPWATIVSPTSAGLIASHYPVLLEEEAEGISLVSHVGRPDDELHELGAHEVLVIVQGPHAYVSPSVYGNGENIATWDHLTAHLHGVPEILDEEENYRVLERLTDHFEHGRVGARSLANDEAGSRRVAKGTTGFRLRVTRFEARAKLSQNKAPEVMARVADDLEARQPALAAEVRRAIPGGPSPRLAP